ncbi:hypothetical protein AVEN_215220-1 [Araneus ventricosus]|uniref:Uncharacterized protein n=1 Tax=Araneus ventricosus TaxID=182803 RepID=A0A4Y2MM48_ARAVE|nr:hypothetical protein AVEN_215220-1 [Araneus ventricosus]
MKTIRRQKKFARKEAHEGLQTFIKIAKQHPSISEYDVTAMTSTNDITKPEQVGFRNVYSFIRKNHLSDIGEVPLLPVERGSTAHSNSIKFQIIFASILAKHVA